MCSFLLQKPKKLLVDALLVGQGALVVVFEILVGLVAESSPIPAIPLHLDDQGLEGLQLALDDGGHIVAVPEQTRLLYTARRGVRVYYNVNLTTRTHTQSAICQ